jgi:hypothetical protein
VAAELYDPQRREPEDSDASGDSLSGPPSFADDAPALPTSPYDQDGFTL